MVSRRGFLASSAAAAASAAAGLGVGAAAATQVANDQAQTSTAKRFLKFEGPHQVGIETPIQAVTNMVTFDLLPGTTLLDMQRWMFLLTDDIRRMANGEPVLADPAPELAIGAARFSAYVGFGPSMFRKLGIEDRMPEGLIDLPAFSIDDLKDEFSGGDVLIHVAADDPVVLSHGVRNLVRDSLPFATVRWNQAGFSHTPGMVPEGVTHRNLMGQVDGTANPALDSDDFDEVVWIKDGPQWIQGGTLLVFRRIAMQLDTWDQLSSVGKGEVIGRTLKEGAPLTGSKESDLPDFEARSAVGLKVIPEFAHIRRASDSGQGERIFRRPFSYEMPISKAGSMDVGLLWCAYQRNIEKQYLPMQLRLAELDLLNRWTLPIGSATFAIPRGVTGDEVIAEGLFS
jgi:dye decolorizing peroxidase